MMVVVMVGEMMVVMVVGLDVTPSGIHTAVYQRYGCKRAEHERN